MVHAYSDDEGTLLVRLARKTVDRYVTRRERPAIPENIPAKLREKSGVFVTLNKTGRSISRLRGCIGRPYPSQPLVEATIDSAVDSATNDSRFPPVTVGELDAIVVELSVLTPPMPIKYDNPDELLRMVEVGKDGLIASQGMWRGLLLPQVPVEYGWDAKTFLEHTCMKAGLPSNQWREQGIEFMSFQAEIFGETAPRGPIVRNPRNERC
ncbi:MAG: TIGR00296 family protein [Candidatus Thorarchaeota archaeon]|nr:TIGR00296 family protein [Candidatus Thorarchaeota archaeon]